MPLLFVVSNKFRNEAVHPSICNEQLDYHSRDFYASLYREFLLKFVDTAQF